MIKIVSVPPGEAPENVRADWVGITLPVKRCNATDVRTLGVMSGPKNNVVAFFVTLFGGGQRERGYLVDAATAVDRLERHAPDAAAWWRKETPHLLRLGMMLLFHECVCERQVEPPDAAAD